MVQLQMLYQKIINLTKHSDLVSHENEIIFMHQSSVSSLVSMNRNHWFVSE